MRSFWKRASHVRLRPTLHLHYYLSLAPLPGHSVPPSHRTTALPRHDQSIRTLINSILALSVSSIHAPPLFQPEKPCCRHYHYRQPFWNNKHTHPPSAKTTTSTLVRTTRAFDCSRLITTRPPPPLRPTSPPTRPLFPGVAFCLIGIAGPHPRRLAPIPSESRLAPVGRATPAAALFLLISC